MIELIFVKSKGRKQNSGSFMLDTSTGNSKVVYQYSLALVVTQHMQPTLDDD